MAGEAKNRRDELVEARELCEAALRAITQQLPIPDKAMNYLRSALGADGSMLMGSSASDQIRKHLEYIVKEIGKIPFIGLSRVAQVVRVDGRDLSEYVN